MYKYNNVVESIRERICSGMYKPGERIPSIHASSKEYGYNSDTIVKAYRLLEEEHLIYSTPKSGYYVVKSFIPAENKKGNIDMITVRPPDCINPYKDFYHCMEKSIGIYKNKLMEYSSPQGMEELRAVLAKYLMNFQIFTNSKDIFITTGAQQALYIISAMPFPGKGRKVLVEQPTYSVMLQTLHCNDISIIGIRRTEEGVDLKELEEIFKTGEIKFFYTMPRYQNPTGFSYCEEYKKEILRLAKKYEVYILEDDYLADLELNPRAYSMYAMGEKEWIIYIKSFSKTLLPGLRLGMAIVPEALQKEFNIFKKSIDINTPVLTQGALEIYLKSSMYKSHVVKTKKFYKNKMEVLSKACQLWLKDKVKYYIPSTGIYAYIELEGLSAETIINKLSKAGILVSSMSNSYLEGVPSSNGIRLCICNCEDEDIKRAIMQLNFLTS
ncbi:MAG TPA: PLP-dependent aminotransferase family protein [Mobilitalea sp.]|nr:PLP-dependent aminotransferase family protein [Mobilitalea sp.]